jgi:hypothetical protein
LESDALGIVSALAAVAFAAVPTRARAARGAAALVFVAVAVLLYERVPTVALASTGIAVAAALMLLRPAWPRVALACAAACAALWAAVLQQQGLALPLALGIAGAAPLAASLLARRRARFAPPALRDEALVLVGACALILAVAPGLIAGWRSAVALQATPLGADAAPAAPWPFAVAAACIALGGVYSVWRRR